MVLAMKDRRRSSVEKAYGYAHYYDADITAEGASYANPAYVKTENPETDMTTDTLFDLASVTKVMATTHRSWCWSTARGSSALEDKVADPVARLRSQRQGRDHRCPAADPFALGCPSGEARLPVLRFQGRAAGVHQESEAENPDSYKTDGSEPKYSDFSFMTLGFIVEALSGQDMDVFSQGECLRSAGHDLHHLQAAGKQLRQGVGIRHHLSGQSLSVLYRMVDEVNWPDCGYDCTANADAFAAFDGWRDYTLDR